MAAKTTWCLLALEVDAASLAGQPGLAIRASLAPGALGAPARASATAQLVVDTRGAGRRHGHVGLGCHVEIRRRRICLALAGHARGIDATGVAAAAAVDGVGLKVLAPAEAAVLPDLAEHAAGAAVGLVGLRADAPPRAAELVVGADVTARAAIVRVGQDIRAHTIAARILAARRAARAAVGAVGLEVRADVAADVERRLAVARIGAQAHHANLAHVAGVAALAAVGVVGLEVGAALGARLQLDGSAAADPGPAKLVRATGLAAATAVGDIVARVGALAAADREAVLALAHPIQAHLGRLALQPTNTAVGDVGLGVDAGHAALHRTSAAAAHTTTTTLPRGADEAAGTAVVVVVDDELAVAAARQTNALTGVRVVVGLLGPVDARVTHAGRLVQALPHEAQRDVVGLGEVLHAVRGHLAGGGVVAVVAAANQQGDRNEQKQVHDSHEILLAWVWRKPGGQNWEIVCLLSFPNFRDRRMA